MRAAVCTRYGPPEVLQLREVEAPSPAAGEVLVKIHATAVNSSDCFIRSAIRSAPLATQILMRLALGITRPRRSILGLVLAGEIAETGKAARRFQEGDRVFAFTKFHFGCYAQYTCLGEASIIASAPSNVTYEEAAAIPFGGLLALHFLRKSNLRSGRQVLVYGASGAVGSAAVQLAKHFGARVTAACGTANLELVRSLGADTAIDYTRENAPDAGKLYDVVLDAAGKRKTSSFKVACIEALAPGGRVVSVDDGTPRLGASDLLLLRELVEAGRFKPVVDRSYPLDQVAEAHRYVEQQHKRGNVVITVAHDGAPAA